MYRQLIGSLMYLVHTRLDIYFALSALSQLMSELRHIHWVDVKHVLRYICSTIGYGLRYSSSGGVMLLEYTDSDWAGSAVGKKSTFEYCFNMVSAMISWSNRK